MVGFQMAFSKLVNETVFTFDVLPSNSNDWNIIKNVILNLKKDFNYGDGLTYSSICDKLENKDSVVEQAKKIINK
jgi:hypothetical protein